MPIEQKSDKNRPSKASVARDFMKKIGALEKNPPENWVKQVEDHLKEQGFSLPASSRVQIYAIKSKAMKKGSSRKGSKSSKAYSPRRSASSKISGNIQKVSIADLSAAKKYASSNGGVDKCIEVFKALRLLS